MSSEMKRLFCLFLKKTLILYWGIAVFYLFILFMGFSNQSILKKSVLTIHWKDWCWSWNFNTLATWCEELTHRKRPWCWGRLRAGEGDDRGLDGWMASLTWWTWVWVNSGSWSWTRKPGVLQSTGLQRVRQDWVNWIEMIAVLTTYYVLHCIMY